MAEEKQPTANAAAEEAAAAQAAAEAAAKAADQGASDGSAKPTDENAAKIAAYETEIEKLKQKDIAVNNRYRRLIQTAQAAGIDTETLKARAKIQDDDDIGYQPPARTPAQQAEFERQIADGEYNPDDIADRVAARLQPQILKMNQRTLAKIAEDNFIKEEANTAVNSAIAIGQEYGLTDDEIEEAFKETNAFGIDVERRGGPSRFAAASVKVMRGKAFEKVLQLRTTKAEATAEDKARAALLAAQPGKGAAPDKKPPTREQKLLAEMNAAGPKSVRSMLGSEQAAE